MSHAISLINESQSLTFAPIEGAEIKYRRIAEKRYQDIVRECRIDDRGPTPLNKEAITAVLKEIVNEDNSFKNLDIAEATTKIYGLLLVGQEMNKTDWLAVQLRVLQWAIQGWTGIGFNATEGDAPLNKESIQAFADTAYGAELFKLVLKDVTEQRLNAQGISSPLGRSNGTLNSASTTAGAIAKCASKTTRKATASHPALRKTSTAKSSKGSASTRKRYL